MRLKAFCAALWLLCASQALVAQTQVQIQKAELAIPFGSISGHILLVGDYLIFMDDDKPESSFAIAKGDVRNMVAEGGVVSVETKQPVKDRSGERSLFNFRLSEVEVASVMNWSSSSSMPPTPVTMSGPTTDQPKGGMGTPRGNTLTYEAKHSHGIFGSCKGTIMIVEERITYESTDDLDHSRQWQFRDIRELKQRGPYVLELEPFIADTFKFELLGKGMDVQDYKMIVARITTARAR